MKFKKLDDLHRWADIDSAPLDHPEGERVFLETEKQLYRLGIRSRLVRSEGFFKLQVPVAHEQVARDIHTGAVSAVYTHTSESYRLFESDLSLRNKKLIPKKRNDGHRRMRVRSMLFMLLSLLILLAAAAMLRGR